MLLTSTCWRNDHNGFSHQGPGLIDAVLPLSPQVVRVWLPPDANSLLSVARHCLQSTDHVNLMVADKQQHLQYLTLAEAEAHCAAGASVWDWAGTERATGASPTWCSPPPGTYPPWRCWPRPSCCGTACPTWRCGWSTWST